MLRAPVQEPAEKAKKLGRAAQTPVTRDPNHPTTWQVPPERPARAGCPHSPENRRSATRAVGSTGLQVIEVKHWSRGYLKSNSLAAEAEAEKLNNKIRKIVNKARRIVPETGFVAGRFLLTREGTSWGEANRPVIKGSAFFTLPEWQDLLEVNGPVRLSDELVERIAQELEPRIKATLHGALRRLGHLTNLELQSPKEERFHRVYRGLHALTRDRVIMHLYDLSAHANAQAERIASREFRAVQRLQKSPWVPRIMDSFQDVPNYPGELCFFSFADPSAPPLQQRAADASTKRFSCPGA